MQNLRVGATDIHRTIRVVLGNRRTSATTSEFGDYQLKADFRAAKQTNSGIFLRTPALFIAIAGGIVAVFLVIKVRFEERLLAARYPAYPAYKAASWGLVPWPRRRS